jgi:pyridoxamine 5'-phosphate oxidase
MQKNNELQNIRKEYRLRELLESNVPDNPFELFGKWWKETLASKLEEPNAMTLATCNAAGKPSARIVLLKGFDNEGFRFYTNYDSRKAIDIEESHAVALVFLWKEIERQVRIEGVARKLGEKENDNYFASRPAESKIGAWSSPQSKIIGSRSLLEKNASVYRDKFGSANIPRPENWGGFIVQPEMIEFWQGRPGRLHDRLQYRLQGDSSWKISRLAP